MSTRSRRALLLFIVTLFVLPIVVAWLQLAGMINLFGPSRTNQGVLVQPVVALQWPAGAELPVGATWALLYPLAEPCDKGCRSTLTGLRALHVALGRKRPHLRLVLISSDANLDLLSIYPEFVILPRGDETLTQPLRQARLQCCENRSISRGPGTIAGIYLVDPRGNIMMYYAQNTDATRIKADLDRLLSGV